MPGGPLNSGHSDSLRRSYLVTSQELHHLRSALDANPRPLVALHALLLIGLDSQLTSETLAERLALSRPDTGRLIDVLVRTGNLRRLPRAGSRSEMVRLTVQGKGVLDTFHTCGCEHVSSALALLDLDHHLSLSLGFAGVENAFQPVSRKSPL